MFPLPLQIETRPSRLLRGALLALHLAAGAALFVADLPMQARAAAVVLLAGSLAWAWPRTIPLRLRGKADGGLEIRRGGTWTAVRLQPDSVALPILIVLRWREGKRRHSLALPPDALPAESHRRLRLWLRWKAGVGATPLQ